MLVADNIYVKQTVMEKNGNAAVIISTQGVISILEAPNGATDSTKSPNSAKHKSDLFQSYFQDGNGAAYRNDLRGNGLEFFFCVRKSVEILISL